MINHKLSNHSKSNSKGSPKPNSKVSPKPLREFRQPATPATKLKLLKLKGFTPPMVNPTNMETGTSTHMPTGGSKNMTIRHPAPSGGYFKSYELNKSIKVNSQAAKEDKQLSEAKQQALNLARIGIHIEELSRSFAQISTPNESKVNIVAEEINGSAQDLLRLAFSYAHKWRTSRRIGVAQSSGYDKDTAVSVPEGENPEAQYLFHPKTLEQMDSSRQTARNDRLLRTAITNRQPTNYYRPPSSPYTSRGGSPAYRGSFNNRGGYYRPSYSQNNGYRPQFNSNYRPNRPAGYTPNTSTGSDQNQHTDACPTVQQAQKLVEMGEEPMGTPNTERGIHDTVCRTASTDPEKGICPSEAPSGSDQRYGVGILGVGDHPGDPGYEYDICLTNIRQGGAQQDPSALRHDPNQRICGQRELQDGGSQVYEGLDTSRGLHLQAGHQVSISSCATAPIISEYVQIHPPEQDVRVPGTAIWTDNRPQSVHKNHEIGAGAAQNNRYSSDILYRRYSHTGNIGRGMPATHQNSVETLGKSWVHNEPRKIGDYTGQQADFPWGSVRHTQDDHPPHPGSNEKGSEGSAKSTAPSANYTTSNGLERAVLSSSSGHRTSCNQITRAPVGYYGCPTEAQLQLQCPVPTKSVDIGGSKVVGVSNSHLELITSHPEVSQSKRARICHHGCFWNRMGNNQQQYVAGWSLGYKNDYGVIKLQGGNNTVTCPEDPCSTLERDQSTTTNRQHYNKGNLHEWRNNSQPQTAELGKGMVEYHHEEQNNSGYYPYTWEGKRPSGLAFQKFSQAVGMEAANHWFKFIDSRPTSSGDRCTDAFMAQNWTLRQPTTNADTTYTEASDHGAFKNGNSGTRLESTALVPAVTENGSNRANIITKISLTMGNESL
ncbi:hypothetical protein BB558_002944 [Smittium angustum]|uniref:Uncharacterized protein n=1 Tax=Smittium angustum TaxID=133377 RepID=A0A2U1J7E2_SMIAN|nr:hypothetical protein BB558_002944 [Smittium angustum]